MSTGRSARRRRRARRRRVALGALACALVALAAAAVALAAFPDRVVTLAGTCRLPRPARGALARSSFLAAADGTSLGVVPGGRNREPRALRRISPWAVAATLAVEDRRFWGHGALDYEAIGRAALADLKAGRIVQGGSTITQQLVRNRYPGGGRRTLGRKLDEACRAITLEHAWGRSRVLAGYLNTVFYGAGAYGIEAASRTYFSRSAGALTLSQAALLAGLPQAPTRYDPLRHTRAARVRRNEVLRAMRTAGELDALEYRAAAGAPLDLRPGRRYARVRAPEFFGFAQRELRRRFGRAAAQGGLRVRTTLDLRLEALARSALDAHLAAPDDPAAALVAIDPRNGAIRALAVRTPGGRRLTFNLATQGRRQEGSAAKVFTLAAALEQGISLSSIWNGPPVVTIPDRRCLNGIDLPWVVHNYADETAGTMTLAQAIAHSVNTIFAQVVTAVGPDRVARMAHRLGVRSPLKPVCSITLGSQAVTPLELTRVFATLAAGGIRREPTALGRVRLASGRVLSRLRPPGRQAISPQTADLVTQALRGVVESGTGTAAAIGRPVAGKTGTAEGYEDAWFCGYAPQLAACVWVGYPHAELPLENVEGLPVVFGGSIPALVWHDFMGGALEGTPVLELP